MDTREQRGLQLAATKRFKRKGSLWIVPSQSGSGSYVVDPQDGSCSCPDFEERGQKCKHTYAVEFTVRRETAADGTVTVTESVTVTRKTYAQNWPAYNAAQMNEKTRVADLLAALCSGIAQPPQTKGRPRLPLRDVVFAATMKVYLTSSGRRASSDLADLAAKGYLSRAPHYNSIFNYLENPSLTPLLKSLIEESANPLKAVERDFAVDASGFSTSTKANWFENKYGTGAYPAPSKRKFIKCHVMCGVKTHVVTSVQVTEGDAHDSPYLPALVATTAPRFDVAEVSADKGYLSKSNLAAIEATGAAAFVPFKINSQGDGNGEIWSRLFHFFSFNRADFLAHYHKRSNVETVFSMVKAKFGGAVRSRTETAQMNEVLLKVLCHNLCVLVQAIYERGLEPTFWPAALPPSAPVLVAGVAS